MSLPDEIKSIVPATAEVIERPNGEPVQLILEPIDFCRGWAERVATLVQGTVQELYGELFRVSGEHAGTPVVIHVCLPARESVAATAAGIRKHLAANDQKD